MTYIIVRRSILYTIPSTPDGGGTKTARRCGVWPDGAGEHRAAVASVGRYRRMLYCSTSLLYYTIHNNVCGWAGWPGWVLRGPGYCRKRIIRTRATSEVVLCFGVEHGTPGWRGIKFRVWQWVGGLLALAVPFGGVLYNRRPKTRLPWKCYPRALPMICVTASRKITNIIENLYK